MKTRVAIWAAVSTPEQAKVDKDSLPSQIRDGKAFAEKRGYDVAAVYEVPGHSRKYIHFHEAARDMEAYAQLERDCQDHAFDVLWCRERSRLGRTRALIHQLRLLCPKAALRCSAPRRRIGLGNQAKASVRFCRRSRHGKPRTKLHNYNTGAL